MEHNKAEFDNPKSLVFKTKPIEKITSRNTLRTLNNAVISAESIRYPNRYYLLELYDDVVKSDPHLKAAMRARKVNILGINYTVLKQSGKVDKKITDLFYKTWFKQLLRYIIDARLYGNSLIELSIDNNHKISMQLIPRVNVIPEFKQIKAEAYNMSGDFSYTSYDNLIDVNNDNDNRDLGELLQAARYIMFKNETILNWMQFTDIFGQPIRKAVTDSNDPDEVKRIEHALENMGRSGWIVMDSATNLELLFPNVSASSQLFDTFIDVIDKQVSKLILGSTMTMDDGSSYKQAEVHERSTNSVTRDDIMFVESVINDHLIPMLQNYGVIGKTSVYFKFDEPDVLTVEQKLAVDQFLIDNFEYKEVDWFNTRYGCNLNNIDLNEMNSKKQIEDNDNNQTGEGLQESEVRDAGESKQVSE